MQDDTPLPDVSSEETKTSEIAEFFNGKSVFITGGAGFVGSVLIESILRCCPGVQSVYVLLREKKGASIESRRTVIFQKRIFQTLRNRSPEVFDKVRAIEGDTTSADLGIQKSVLQELQDHVAVVFHCAAVISFMKPLRFIIEQNVIATENVVNFCRKLSKLEALVYTSTAYSNCNVKDEIKEEIYKLTIPARKFLDVVRSGSDDAVLTKMQTACGPPWPNTYTLSKAIAENFLNDEVSDIPIAIIRPSIILGCWKGCMPGYIEEGAGLIDVSLGIGKGFIRVLYCDENKIVDIVPVDGVANTMITAAWAIASKKMETPLVVNFTSSEFNPCTWGYFVNSLYNMNRKHPLPKMYQKPSLVMRKYSITYWASAAINHYAPAVCIDAVLLALRKKPKLTKLYKFYDLALKYLGFFLVNEWHFKSDNLRRLDKLQNSKDAELFPVDLTGYDADTFSESVQTGAPFYQWEIDSRPRKDRMNLAFKRYLLTTFIKWAVISWLLFFMVFIITKSVFRNIVD